MAPFVAWATLLSYALANANASASTVMATLPANTVPGISEDLTVLEDLTHPGSAIVFKGATLRYEITKTARQSHILALRPFNAFQKWPKSGFELCFGPSTLGAWAQNTSPYAKGCGLS